VMLEILSELVTASIGDAGYLIGCPVPFGPFATINELREAEGRGLGRRQGIESERGARQTLERLALCRLMIFRCIRDKLT
jgi:hypothetical protein